MRIDRFRVAELERRLRALRLEWEEIQHPIEEFSQETTDLGSAKAAKSLTRSAVKAFFRTKSAPADESFCRWANDVVTAFGVKRFPTYSVQPPKIDLGDEKKLSALAGTGCEDKKQAGMRIIWWCALNQCPELTAVKRGQPRASWKAIDNWAAELIVRVDDIFSGRPEPLAWVEAALAALVSEFRESDEDGFSQLISNLKEPLSENERDVLQAIYDAAPNAISLKQLSAQTGIESASITTHTIPRLKKAKLIKNRRNVGYYLLSAPNQPSAKSAR